jgi:SNF2 family DNA or RNA helicase
MSLAALGPDLADFKPQFPFNDSQAQLGAYPLDGAAGPMIPSHINKFLKPYQRTGVQFMYDLYKQNRGGILGDDMGLGKTVQVISFVSRASELASSESL